LSSLPVPSFPRLTETVRGRVRGAAAHFGFERGADGDPPAARLVRLLDAFEADLVVDVGARAGRFGGELRRAGYRGRIASFEPLDVPRRHLERAAAQDDAWSVLPYALGDGTGEARRLDELWEQVVAPGERAFLKLDVRDHASRVLRGAGEHADELTGLQVRTSFAGPQADGLLFDEALTLARGTLGMSLMSLVPGPADPSSGRLLRCDLVLFRKDAL
ncbi:hypothetical protein, partial [Streptomyces boluensis]